MGLLDIQAGTTKRFTWVNSGVTPTAISAAVMSGSESLVSSVAMTSSATGHYYADITVPNSSAFFVAKYTATISTKDYISKKRFRTVLGNVD